MEFRGGISSSSFFQNPPVTFGTVILHSMTPETHRERNSFIQTAVLLPPLYASFNARSFDEGSSVLRLSYGNAFPVFIHGEICAARWQNSDEGLKAGEF